jgi:alanine racemase
MFHTSVIELSLSALRKNLRFLRGITGSYPRFTSVIKGNAYGHGISVFLPLAEQCGVRSFAVFSADEALQAIRARTEGSHVMIMGAIDNDQIGWAIENDVSFYVFEPDRLRAAAQVAKGVGRPARIHLEVETGLNRTGFDASELRGSLELIRSHAPCVVVEGVCTHLAGAESIGNYLRIIQQLQAFHDLRASLAQQDVPLGLAHAACSAAIFAYPASILDMVRVGIAHYGFWPSLETRMHYLLQHVRDPHARVTDPLRRVMEWKSRIMSLKPVKPGEFVGYGTSYLTSRPQRIATVPVGYFHGFARNLSNLGHVLLHGRRANVVGAVNMNMMMIDVSDFPHAQKGDEVVIIGRQKRAHISVASFSDMTRFLNYEVLVRLPSEIPRRVVA